MAMDIYQVVRGSKPVHIVPAEFRRKQVAKQSGHLTFAHMILRTGALPTKLSHITQHCM
jgi:hypothetical protein